jgi:hypothetical protein
MPIQVTCPGCLSRFAVSEKYAGKKGPCPKCKKEITIPDVAEQVVIHAPEHSGPKDSKGVSVLKPITRTEFKVGKVTWILCSIAILAILAIALGVRFSGTEPPTILLILGAVGLAPPIVMLGYTFFRDDELEGYTGQEYLIRTAICSTLFAMTWLIYWGLGYYFENDTLSEITTVQMAIFIGVMAAVGLGVSLVTFELEVGQAALHYLAYFAICFLLAMLMGVEMGEPLAKPKPRGQNQRRAAAVLIDPIAGDHLDSHLVHRA